MGSTLKIGMVGLDTSHCPTFTRILNDREHEYHLPGAQVIGAYPGGSDLFSRSRDRVKGFTEELEGTYGLAMYDHIPDLVRDVDAILLESVDGRQHLEQFRQMAVGKPVYIDKPMTTSTAEALDIVRLAEETGTPIMSSSSLRYAAGIADLVEEEARVLSCEAFGPAALLEDYPGLFWYGIHGAEILFTFMGAGCQQVRCVGYPDVDVVIGEWEDGRIGILKGTRFERGAFGCVVHTDRGTRCGVAQSRPPYYLQLLRNVLGFFESGVSPIDIGETLNIISFLEAADTSRERGGKAVSVPPTVIP
jgi:predicted dehydrogenase